MNAHPESESVQTEAGITTDTNYVTKEALLQAKLRLLLCELDVVRSRLTMHERVRSDPDAPCHQAYWETLSLPVSDELRQQLAECEGTIVVNENLIRRLNENFWSESADILAKDISLEEELQSVKEVLDKMVRNLDDD